jgi:hypothetical protein
LIQFWKFSAMTRGATHGFRKMTPNEGKPAGRLTRKIKALNQFIDYSGPELDHVEFRIWMILFRHATDGIVTRSHGLLAKDMSVSARTVQRAIGRLIEKKLVRVVQRGGLHVGASTYGLGSRNRRQPRAEPEAPETAPTEPMSTGHQCPPMADTAVSNITDYRNGTAV